MRRQCYVALAVALVTLGGCAGTIDEAQPSGVPGTAAGLGGASSPPPTPTPLGTATPVTTASVTTARKTGKPRLSATSKPAPSVAENVRGELSLDGPPTCWWVPHAFLDGAGGLSIQFTVRSVSVVQATHIEVTVVGASGERGGTRVNLPMGDAQQGVSVTTNADQGSYQANLAVSLDPAHDILQTNGYDDDTGSVRVVIPFPRPSSTSALSCYMVH